MLCGHKGSSLSLGEVQSTLMALAPPHAPPSPHTSTATRRPTAWVSPGPTIVPCGARPGHTGQTVQVPASLSGSPGTLCLSCLCSVHTIVKRRPTLPVGFSQHAPSSACLPALVLPGTPRRVFPGRWRRVGDFTHVHPCAGYGTFWARCAATVGPGLVRAEVYVGASLWRAVPNPEDTTGRGWEGNALGMPGG